MVRAFSCKRSTAFAVALMAMLGLAAWRSRDDSRKEITQAAKRSTLNQQGTEPFHLRAELAPSFERDANSGRTGTIEIWWASPTQWKRDVRCPSFHQLAILNGGREWQHNDGDYFPEWLRETAVALVNPIPQLDVALAEADTGEGRNIFGTNHVSWQSFSSDGTVKKAMGCGIDVSTQTGLLSFAGCLGWGGAYKDYKKFGNRVVARTVTHGSREVTAKISVLDRFDPSPADFAPPTNLVSSPLIHTIVLDEVSFRKNLLPQPPVQWPPVADGPLQGILTTASIVVDRQGAIRDVGMLLSDNPNLNDAASKFIQSMKFKPFVVDGDPVQVVSRITMPFDTVRPAGMETFRSARHYFERGRQITSPAFSHGKPYVLRATFRARVSGGTVETGQYVDTWESEEQWKREATIGSSRFIRSRHGDKYYRLAEGPDAGICGLVLMAIEPIPAIDTFVESDWRISRDSFDGLNAIRVLSGDEPEHDVFDPDHARAYWFDSDGRLVRAFTRLDLRYSNFANFNGAQVPQDIRIFKDNQLGVIIQTTEMSRLEGSTSPKAFDLRGHEWKRMFTAEAR